MPVALPPTPPVLLEPGGPYVRADLPDRAAPTGWLGLTLAGGRSALVRVRVALVPEVGAIDVAGQTATKVVASLAPPPFFVLHGVRGLRPGAVRTVVRKEIALDGAAGVAGTLGARPWRLHVEGRRIGKVEPFLADGKLVLTEGARRQVLVDLAGKGEAHPGTWAILWAGDLDRDGRPDFYLNASTHYASSERSLFLSGAAGPGELVRRVAGFAITQD